MSVMQGVELELVSVVSALGLSEGTVLKFKMEELTSTKTSEEQKN